MGDGTGIIHGIDVTPDGEVWVGTDRNSPLYNAVEAFRQTLTDIQYLGDLPGGEFYSIATAVSHDGRVVVGQSDGIIEPIDYGQPWVGTVAVYWKDGLGPFILGGYHDAWIGSIPHDVSADGSVVVGYGNGTTNTDEIQAFRWTQASGVMSIHELLLDEGIDVAAMGWTLESATAVSADGTIIAGWGRNPSGQSEAWLVELPIPEPTSAFLALLGAACVLRRRR